MSQVDPARHTGQGIASLVFDASRDAYLCYWLIGTSEDHLIDQVVAPNAPAAVAWARSRTPRARIRTPDRCTYWAGSDPAPGGFAGVWAEPSTRAGEDVGVRADGGRSETALGAPDAPVAAA